MVKSKSKSKSKSAKAVQKVEEVEEEVEETVEETVEAEVTETTEPVTNTESPEWTFASLLERIISREKQLTQMFREQRADVKQLLRSHNREVKSARKNRKSNNANRGSKQPSGFNRPQPVPKEFTVSPWNCDPDEQLPRTVLTKKVYDYVKLNNLQQDSDKRIIHPDSTVRKLFHLKPLETIEFRTFQTFMARLYKGETVSEDEAEAEPETPEVEVEVEAAAEVEDVQVEVEESHKKKKSKSKKSKRKGKGKGKSKSNVKTV